MTRERYESISLHDLREIAKNRGMRRISTLKKAELIDAMMQKDEEEAKALREEKKAQRSRAAAAAAEAAATAAEAEEAAGGTAGADDGGTKTANRGGTDRESGQGRQRGYGQQAPQGQQAQRGRQGSGNGGPGNANARRTGTRQYRDDGQGGQSGRGQRQQRPGQGQTGQGRDLRRNQRQQARPAGAQAAGETIPVSESAAPGQAPAGSEAGSSRAAAPAGNTGYAEKPVSEAALVREPAAPYAVREEGTRSDRDRRESRDYDGAAASQGGQADASAGRTLPRYYYQPGRPDTPVLHKDELNTELDSGQLANGILEVMQDGFGFIRCANYMPGENDIYVAPSQIRRFGLKTGDIIVGNIRVRTQGEKFSALLYVKSVNGFSPEEATRRYNFEDMTPIFPDERIRLERAGGSIAMRIMDLMSPVGKGQRGMIVSPPKAGKTTLLKEVARSVKYNNPEIHLIVLLIDERPEEVTDIREAIEGPNAEVIYSTFDELPEHHKRVSEMAIERARRLVEHKKDVMILLDSITRLTRAYNITEPPSGRTLSGGLDPAALHMPKRFFGAARNMREGGSLTILATALIDTGSKMDDIVFEEFKGTGNMELVLDRRLSERRIFPAIDLVRSGTRRDDLLLTPDEQNAMGIVRRAFNGMSSEQAVTQALDLFSRTRTNGEFVNMVRKIQWGMNPDHNK